MAPDPPSVATLWLNCYILTHTAGTTDRENEYFCYFSKLPLMNWGSKDPAAGRQREVSLGRLFIKCNSAQSRYTLKTTERLFFSADLHFFPSVNFPALEVRMPNDLSFANIPSSF